MLHYTLYSLFAASVAAQSFRPDPRWGPAFTSFRGHLVVHGGKTNPGNGYTYSSGPTSSDLFALDLTSSFPVSNPPWRQITDSYNSSSSQGPPASFHTLSAFSSSQLLLFGGDAGAQIALPTGTDSAWVLGLDDFSNVSWSRNPQNLASEPVRTQNHAATAIGNQVWIIGGERLDGSAIVAQTFTYAGSSFDLFDSPLPLPPIAGHRALTITDGRIITLGGRSNPSSTPNSMSSLYALNASADPVSWTQVPATGNIPSARRNFVATTLSNNRIIIHGGAGDSFNPPQNILSDGFILDASQDPMIWRHIPSLSELGPRTDHIAISRGSLVLFLFGWSGSNATGSDCRVYNTESDKWVDEWDPEPAPTNTASDGGPSETNPAPSHSSSSSPTTSAGGSPSSPTGERPLALALAVVFGVLAFVAAIGVVSYLAVKRRQHRRGGSFHIIDEKDPYADRADASLHPTIQTSKIQMAGSPSGFVRSWVPPSILLRMKHRPKERVDMLADEYAESLASRRRPMARRTLSANSVSSSISNWYEAAGHSARSWSETVGQSIGRLRGGAGALSRTHTDTTTLDPFRDDTAAEQANRPSYIDGDFNNWPATSTDHQAINLLGDTDTPANPPVVGVSAIGAMPSMIGSSHSPDTSIRRSDSWWTRLSRTSVLEQYMSGAGTSSKTPWSGDPLLNFRDPHPAPRLVPIEEATQHSGSGGGTRRSISSAATSKTADSEGMEQVAGMDVILRAESLSSRATDESEGGDPIDLVESPMEESNRIGEEAILDGQQSPSSHRSAAQSERRLSQDLPEGRPPRRSINYGLVPRPQLFITNPDSQDKNI